MPVKIVSQVVSVDVDLTVNRLKYRRQKSWVCVIYFFFQYTSYTHDICFY